MTPLQNQVRMPRRTGGLGYSDTPDLMNEKLETKTFLPLDVRPNG